MALALARACSLAHVIPHPGAFCSFAFCLVRILCGRATEDAKDEVASGLHGNLITQRLKLNGRVALVTGASSCCVDA